MKCQIAINPAEPNWIIIRGPARKSFSWPGKVPEKSEFGLTTGLGRGRGSEIKIKSRRRAI